MAQNVQLRIDTGVEVFFCDPQSPWQHGTNENTNGLLRQYFPRLQRCLSNPARLKLPRPHLPVSTFRSSTRARRSVGPIAEQEFAVPRTARAYILASLAIALGAPVARAAAAPTESAVLGCGSNSYTVEGFGRGQVLHVVGSTSNYVVTRAVLGDGTVVFNSPAKADRPLVICTTVTPAGRSFTFTGFFT